jgi:cytochrome P450 family 6
MLMRKAHEDYKVPNSNHVIPKGSDVWIPIIGFQNDEKYWKNPTVFNPDRFEEKSDDRPSFAFMPFG